MDIKEYEKYFRVNYLSIKNGEVGEQKNEN